MIPSINPCAQHVHNSQLTTHDDFRLWSKSNNPRNKGFHVNCMRLCGIMVQRSLCVCAFRCWEISHFVTKGVVCHIVFRLCLFCFVLYRWDPPNWDASDCVLGLFVKLSWGGGGGGGGGVHWFGFMAFGLAV
jgi:hypothetical protein